MASTHTQLDVSNIVMSSKTDIQVINEYIQELKSSKTDIQVVNEYIQELKSQGIQGSDLYEAVAEMHVSLKRQKSKNRCQHCWHDKTKECICEYIPNFGVTGRHQREQRKRKRTYADDKITKENNEDSEDASSPSPLHNVKVLLLMHYKEYYSAGNSGKLLISMFPNAELFIFGLKTDWERLVVELAVDPQHNMVLWPGSESISLDEFIIKTKTSNTTLEKNEEAPFSSSSSSVSVASPCIAKSKTSITTPGAKAGTSSSSPSPPSSPSSSSSSFVPNPPYLRVVILDGSYNHANNMHKCMTKRLPLNLMPLSVALHPTTKSIFHRSLKSYSKNSARVIKDETNQLDSKAMRTSTVEAFALLLSELGERKEITCQMIDAVRINNLALKHDVSVRPTRR